MALAMEEVHVKSSDVTGVTYSDHEEHTKYNETA